MRTWIICSLALIVLGIPLGASEFLGYKRCGSCHFKELKSWKDTPHFKSFDCLKTDKDQKDPDCLKCHTTGYQQPTGFTTLEQTPDLTNVQCESCHGMGADHRDRMKAAEDAGKKLKEDPMFRMSPQKNVCIGCHNPHLGHENMRKFLREVKKMEQPQPGIAETPDNLPYVGGQVCSECHQKHSESWKDMKHAKAFQALDKPEYQKDPKCLACHTTGYGEQGGFSSLQQTPTLTNVQCESCHGPGQRHVTQAKEAKAQGLKLTMEQTQYNNVKNECTACHNPHISHKKMAAEGH